MRSITLFTVLILSTLTGCRQATTYITFCALPIEGAPLRGSADATVTIVEFSDFQCEYCGRAATTIEQLLLEYPDEVRLAFRHLPLSYHEHSRPAAIAAACAQEQDLFWEFHDLLFANQQALNEQDLLAYAEEVGLDLVTWDSCRSSQPARDRVDEDLAESIRIGIGATPTFFINGEPLVGAQPVETFSSAVERALVDAADSSLATDEYYDSLVEMGCE